MDAQMLAYNSIQFTVSSYCGCLHVQQQITAGREDWARESRDQVIWQGLRHSWHQEPHVQLVERLAGGQADAEAALGARCPQASALPARQEQHPDLALSRRQAHGASACHADSKPSAM